jgi:hypothetical protein
MQALQLVVFQASAKLFGMNPGAPQAFIGVDIADAAHHTLIEQQRFDARFSRLNPRAKFVHGDFQRLQSQAAEDAFVVSIGEQRHAAEPANVVVTELAAIIEREKNVCVKRHRSIRRADADFASHAEMNEQRTFFRGRLPRLEVERKKFP